MTIATPYPEQDRLLSAAQEDELLICHQCHGDQRRCRSCPACLGTGFVRPCGRCLVHRRTLRAVYTPCLVCAGLGYTAGSPPDREESYSRRPPDHARRN